METGDGPHRGQVPLPGGLCGQGAQLPGVRSILVWVEVVISHQDIYVAWESRDPGCERVGGSLRGQVIPVSVQGKIIAGACMFCVQCVHVFVGCYRIASGWSWGSWCGRR